jgi:hypothetical protein
VTPSGDSSSPHCAIQRFLKTLYCARKRTKLWGIWTVTEVAWLCKNCPFSTIDAEEVFAHRNASPVKEADHIRRIMLCR